MVASHIPDSPPFRAPHIHLNPTRDGLRAFMIKFHAILSPDLSNTLDNYLDNPRAPKTEEAKSAHKAIWRALVPCLNGLDDLLLRIHRDCRQHDGPQALFWLIKDLDDNAPVTSIKAVVDIIKTVTKSSVYTYADDTTLIITATTINALEELAQSELTNLINYFHQNNLVPNPTKTNYSIF